MMLCYRIIENVPLQGASSSCSHMQVTGRRFIQETISGLCFVELTLGKCRWYVRKHVYIGATRNLCCDRLLEQEFHDNITVMCFSTMVLGRAGLNEREAPGEVVTAKPPKPVPFNYFKKGSSYKCQKFSRSGHSHKIMQMWHALEFSNKNITWEFNTIIYGYTKPGEWIQILTKVVSVIYCSAGGSNGILCFLAVT